MEGAEGKQSGLSARKTCFHIVLGIIFFSACSSPIKKKSEITDGDLLLKRDADLILKQKLGLEELRRDIRILRHALEEGYGGRRHQSQDLMQEVFYRLREVEDRPPLGVSSHDFQQIVDGILSVLPDCRLEATVPGGGPSLERLKQNGKPRVGSNLSRTKVGFWELQYREVTGFRIPVISLLGFPEPNEPPNVFDASPWDGFLEAMSKVKQDSPALILDLRGASGSGDPSTLEVPGHLAEAIFGQGFPMGIERKYFRQSPSSIILKLNQIRLKSIRLNPSFGSSQRTQEELRYETLLSRAISREAEWEVGQDEPDSPSFDEEKSFGRPLALVTDKGCSGSCEFFAKFFETYPKAKRFGENTAGCIHSSGVGVLVLPASRIEVRIPTEFVILKNQKFVEKVGLPPDVFVNPDRDALSVALEAIASEIREMLRKQAEN